MSGFRDHFSGHAREYAAARPSYPPALAAWLARVATRRGTVWDCGTGSGQAAVSLARKFNRVVASDASLRQLGQRTPGTSARFVAALSTASPLARGAVDLVTVAQAMHWFDLDPFYREVRRVLAPGGVLAAWTYGLLRTSPGIDARIDRFAGETVGAWWPAERRHVDAGYADLDFPFAEIRTPSFTMRMQWSLDELLRYLRTWSAVRRSAAETGTDPVDRLRSELLSVWGPERAVREIRWHLAMRVGRI